ncbi:MAG: hypothetical protein IJZ35_07720 [Clostridia bacterium]|nr:hypothetical protein [Clostridia bacterium]
MSSDYIFRNAAFGGFNKSDVMQYIASLKEKEAKIEAEKSEMLKELNQLKTENAEYSQRITAFEQSEADNIAEIDSLKAELDALRAEYEEKLSNCIADRSVEEAVGSAMIDVRRYADMLLQETCDKIDTMSENADDAAAKTLTRVLDITSGIQTFSDKLNTILADIINENEKICRDLTSFKGSLKLPFETAAGKLETEILLKDN